MNRTNFFNFNLPESLIAQSPTLPRDYARMMILDRVTGKIKTEYQFFDLISFLKKGDVLVLNKTRVSPYRLNFEWKGKLAEILLVKRMENGDWQAMVRPGKYFKVGDVLEIWGVNLQIMGVIDGGLRMIRFFCTEEQLIDLCNTYGKLPLPPYIEDDVNHYNQYNTVFADKGGSVAAPTAGLHFTTELLSKLESFGVQIESINLEVGLGTFLPVKTDYLENHLMHKENYSIDYFTAKRLNKAVLERRRIVAVGTTVTRSLEDNFGRFGVIMPGDFSTNIFIYPGYQWKIVKAMITNFHLPKSTLLMLVCSFAGSEFTLRAYQKAVESRYKFYSFGDAMLII